MQGTRKPRNRAALGHAALLAGLLTAGALAVVQAPVRAQETQPAPPVYQQRTPTEGGTGKVYLGRETAIPVSHAAAGWLERPERETEEKPRLLVEALPLQPDDVVADVGAGTGYYSFRIAARVPRGKVLAVDIEPLLLEHLRSTAAERGVTNVEPSLGTIEDPRLPEGAVDLVLIVDAYHEFSHPREMMQAIVRSLKPDGKLALVEYRAEDPDLPIHPLHKMTEAQARLEMEAAGLVHLETRTHLPRQHLMFFQKRPVP